MRNKPKVIVTDGLPSYKQAFNKEFYDPKTGLYDGGTQTAMSCALYHGLVPQEERAKVLGRLVDMIQAKDGHLDAGILGTKYLIDSLTAGGRADVVYGMATKTDYPSWGRWLEQGATTLWEQWDGGASRNHIMFGDISAWFYKQLAGINIDPAPLTNTGFKHIIIRPRPAGDLTWVRAEHNCPYGLIKTYWHRKADKFTLEVTIPANTTATIYVPTSDAESVREGGKLASNVSDVQFIGIEGNCAAFAVGAGKYRFVSTLVQ
jgi:alpha-L-rhamnosidase